jgi:hypothetical protein
MRYREIAASSNPSMRERLSTVTLYVLPHEWARLDNLRHSYGPTLVIGRRDLSPRFPGTSVNLLCASPEEASRLLGDWVYGGPRA